MSPLGAFVALRRLSSSVLLYWRYLLCSVSTVLAIMTSLWRDWIEAFTGFDPDHQSGAVEAAIVASLLAVSLGFALAARRWTKRRRDLLTPQARSGRAYVSRSTP